MAPSAEMGVCVYALGTSETRTAAPWCTCVGMPKNRRTVPLHACARAPETGRAVPRHACVCQEAELPVSSMHMHAGHMGFQFLACMRA